MKTTALRLAKQVVSSRPAMAGITLALRAMGAAKIPDYVVNGRDPVGAALSLGLSPVQSARARQLWRRAGLLAAHHLNTPKVPVGQGQRALLLTVAKVPDSARLQLASADLFAKSRGVAADPIFDNILSRFDDDPRAVRAKLQLITRRRGRRAAYRRAMQIGADAPAAIIATQAQCLEDLGYFDAADEVWSHAMERGGEDEVQRFAGSLIARGYVDRGLTLLSSLPRNPEHEKIKAHFGSILNAVQQGDYTEEMASADGYLPAAMTAPWFADEAARRATAPSPDPSRFRKIILINASLGLGGAERQCVSAAIALKHALPDYTIEVWVRTLDSRKPHSRRLPELREAGIRVRAIDRFSDSRQGLARQRPGLDIAPLQSLLPIFEPTSLRLLNGLLKHKPDIVHLWQDASASLMGLPALWSDTPVIAVSFRSLPPPDKGLDRPHLRPFIRGLCAAPNVRASVNSQVGRARYAEWLDLDASDISIVQNAISDLGRPSVRPQDEEHVSRMVGSLRPHDRLIVGVMRLDENKRPDDWIRIAERVAEIRPETGFVLVGAGPLHGELKALIAEKSLQDTIILNGASSHPHLWLERADVLLHTSVIEGLPNALIEAQAAGCAVVATDAGGAREAFLPGETGLLLPQSQPLNVEDAAQTLCQLLNDTDTLASMGTEAVRYSARTFSVEAMCTATLRLYGLDASESA